MICRVVHHGSPDYLAAVELRREVLRYPLGLDFTPEELAAEDAYVHFVMKDGDQVVATATATDLGDRVVKIRQVAVDFSLRGKGHGREIMLCSEEWAKEAGFKTVSLHARAVVMEFYLKLGYEIVGDGFEEVGIPHRKMVKKLD